MKKEIVLLFTIFCSFFIGCSSTTKLVNQKEIPGLSVEELISLGVLTEIPEEQRKVTKKLNFLDFEYGMSFREVSDILKKEPHNVNVSEIEYEDIVTKLYKAYKKKYNYYPADISQVKMELLPHDEDYYRSTGFRTIISFGGEKVFGIFYFFDDKLQNVELRSRVEKKVKAVRLFWIRELLLP